MDLSGSWQLTDLAGEYSCEIRFPGDGITALLEAGLIPDPYWGRNEYGLRWIAERDWIARREIELEDPAQVLVIDGLDCVAEVRLNGTLVLSAASVHRIHRADLLRVARPGRNLLEILFRSNPAEANRRQAAQPVFVPYQHVNGPIPNANMLRKAQCDFGWDWNIALAPFGVVNGIRLEPALPYRIAGIVTRQEHGKGRVKVSVELHLEAARVAPFDWEISLCGQVVRGPGVFADRSDRLRAELVIRDPELWWPNGQGAQVLHELKVRVGSQTASRRIGLRDIRLVLKKDRAGSGFTFRVNGRDIFMKGANWIPADALPGRITAAKTRDLLQSAVDVHMNMIRIWGGGRYEADWFYDLCDELGLLVWQDFMFACHLYPADEAFLAEVAGEVREQALRLGHHACLALWCGDNELLGALNWFEQSRKNRDYYLVSYDRLNRTIERALKEVLPDPLWWPSSPSPGYLNFGDAWHNDGSGDMHFWSVWHEGRDFDHYRDVSPRFCSEFGFQSYPSLNVITGFADSKDRNIAAPVFESHQKNGGGNARIAETMFRYFRFPVDFENFVWLSQIQQGLAIKTAVTHWRSLRPQCMGTLYWQLNDTWPVCSWSSLDYGGGWKLLHHMALGFYAPVLVTAVPEADGRIRLVAVNDMPEPHEIRVSAFALRPDGALRALGTGAVTVGSSAGDLLVLPAGTLAADELLLFSAGSETGGEMRDVFAPSPWKSYDLPDPQLTHDVSREGADFVLTVSAKEAAFFVTAEADLPGRWDRNALHLLPGESLRLRFIPQGPGAAPAFRLRDLYTATCLPG